MQALAARRCNDELALGHGEQRGARSGRCGEGVRGPACGAAAGRQRPPDRARKRSPQHGRDPPPLRRPRRRGARLLRQCDALRPDRGQARVGARPRRLARRRRHGRGCTRERRGCRRRGGRGLGHGGAWRPPDGDRGGAAGRRGDGLPLRRGGAARAGPHLRLGGNAAGGGQRRGVAPAAAGEPLLLRRGAVAARARRRLPVHAQGRPRLWLAHRSGRATHVQGRCRGGPGAALACVYASGRRRGGDGGAHVAGGGGGQGQRQRLPHEARSDVPQRPARVHGRDWAAAARGPRRQLLCRLFAAPPRASAHGDGAAPGRRVLAERHLRLERPLAPPGGARRGRAARLRLCRRRTPRQPRRRQAARPQPRALPRAGLPRRRLGLARDCAVSGGGGAGGGRPAATLPLRPRPRRQRHAQVAVCV
mmetsp:Transcript_17084/g.66539  ORF Transcript_17084/g.66539 Transcript_17084/m.66539 type:complete len:421 (+) Transcript_17084:112-1374(+)